ncbi:hypothetical protein HY993_03220 [Candidatus Micrarchaeota archaeon]|nr:hypothetical protein [Candidatus Micrarchaeota archaeon]
MIQDEQPSEQPIQQSVQPMGQGVGREGVQPIAHHGHLVKQSEHSIQQPRSQKPGGERKQFVKKEGSSERRAGGREPGNIVFIGKKPPLVYAFAVVAKFNDGQKQVVVKARGNSIVTGVNVTQLVKHKFIPTLQIGRIEITTEELTAEDGKTHRVSAILIPLTKE